MSGSSVVQSSEEALGCKIALHDSHQRVGLLSYYLYFQKVMYEEYFHRWILDSCNTCLFKSICSQHVCSSSLSQRICGFLVRFHTFYEIFYTFFLFFFFIWQLKLDTTVYGRSKVWSSPVNFRLFVHQFVNISKWLHQ